MTDTQSILDKFNHLRMWRRDGVIASHKPLLVLYALGQFSQGREELPYDDVDKRLGELLKEFGQRARRQGTHYPFHHLQNDGVWEVTADVPLTRRDNNAPGKTQLRERHAVGAFPEAVKGVLKDPRNLRAVATAMLGNNFPETYHRDILEAVGLNLDTGPASGRRSRDFRPDVLRAYERRCCVCGYDARIGDRAAGIEAAHIKWHQAGGPDIVPNGLALCTLHHKIFDLGAFTVDVDDLKLVFSEELTGTAQMEWLLGFHGRPMRRPLSESYLPDREFLDWHRNTIFRCPQRDLPDRNGTFAC